MRYILFVLIAAFLYLSGFFLENFVRDSTELFPDFSLFWITCSVIVTFAALLAFPLRVNGPILVICFFWFFYLFGLFTRPIFYPQNISHHNGIVMNIAFYLALLGSIILYKPFGENRMVSMFWVTHRAHCL